MSAPSIGLWLESAVAALSEVATCTLGLPAPQMLDNGAAPPSGQSGAYVPLIGPDEQLYIGLVAGDAEHQLMTRALLGMDATSPVTREEIADAVGEIGNIVSGGVKTRMLSLEPKLSIGLPIFIHGELEPSPRMETAVARLKLGDLSVSVIVVRSSHAGGGAGMP